MTTKHYPDIEANPNFAALEQEILTFWAENRTFEQSVAQRPATKADGSSNAYVFYDGPPFANGSPHYGHLLTGYVKDAIARYHTMRGKRVERRFGWDCHGLPAEMGAEKELHISGRAAIIEYGIEKFNAHCRTSVMKYVGDWRYYVTRQGRWVDFDNDYKTMDTPYMESVLWAFSELYKKGLIYESMRVMPYSWAAETPVSNFETRIDNATREREDKAAYVKFTIKNPSVAMRKHHMEATKFHIIAWTTTPWTLPSNLALAVNKEMRYSIWQEGTECYIASTAYANKYLLEKYKNTPEISPRDHQFAGELLLNLTYEPLFPYFADTPNAFRVLDGSAFVTDSDGTGIVHMAPGFGEVDQKCCAENGIEVMVPVDGQGKYTSEMFDILLETRRLTLRAFAEHDFELYKALQSDPNVAATTSDGILPDEKIRAEFNRFLADQATKGFTQWAVFRKSDGAFLGRAGFDNRDYDQFNTSGKPAVELRYAYLSDFWGQGYGTEIATGLLDWAAAHLPVPLIIAGCNPTYDPAKKLLTKLGFTPHENVDFRNQPVLFHTLEIADWREKRGAITPPPKALLLQGLNVVADTRLEDSDTANMDPRKVDRFKDHVKKYGLANMRIIRWLDDHHKLVKQEEIKHNYPHCWRTDTPLIYRAMSSWYVNVQAIKENMVANNQTIHWIPDHVKDGQMGRGIESAPDWSISRNRFWGTPIPIWRSTNPDSKEPLKVFGSIAELEQFFGVKVPDLHRPFIDDLKAPDPSGGEYIRVEDVFDCWFESGSMPYAQVHYPFENKTWFEENFPADFITEYIAQTRGWFYTLQVLSAALFGKAPFKNVICHGVVIDEETGLKYSKRLKNYKDPKEVMDNFGADALRWMMLASPVMRGADLGVDPDGKFIRDVVRLNIKPLWSAFNFFTLYANADGVKARRLTPPPLAGEGRGEGSVPAGTDRPTSPPPPPNLLPQGEEGRNLLDRYILAKARATVEQVRASLDAYDTPGATEAITAFLDVLNNWYIRRSRPRFWGSDMTADKQSAYDTLFTVIELICLVSAPLLPFVSEAIYRGLNGVDTSVHLQDFPDVSGIDIDTQLLIDMDWVREICNAGFAIRNKKNIRTRQPLKSLDVYGTNPMVARFFKETDRSKAENTFPRLAALSKIVEEEVNVKDVKYWTLPQNFDAIATRKLQIFAQVLGKRLPEKMKQILPAAKKGEWEYAPNGGGVIVAGELLQGQNGEYNIILEPKPEYKDAAEVAVDVVIMLDTTITPELEAEGRARDLVRMIQQARKDAGLNVGDRITLGLDVPSEFESALATHGDYIASQTLAVSWQTGSAHATQKMKQELDGAEFIIGISKAA